MYGLVGNPPSWRRASSSWSPLPLPVPRRPGVLEDGEGGGFYAGSARTRFRGLRASAERSWGCREEKMHAVWLVSGLGFHLSIAAATAAAAAAAAAAATAAAIPIPCVVWVGLILDRTETCGREVWGWYRLATSCCCRCKQPPGTKLA